MKILLGQQQEVDPKDASIHITPGARFVLEPGDWFAMTLPDGIVLDVEQTSDDFSITVEDGKGMVEDDVVITRHPTSQIAKKTDELIQLKSGHF